MTGACTLYPKLTGAAAPLAPVLTRALFYSRKKLVFFQALSLLTEIRETLVGLLLPQQSRVKDAITEKLDIELIAQQAANNVLDVKAHGLFIIDLMGKLCAPVRDEVSVIQLCTRACTITVLNLK